MTLKYIWRSFQPRLSFPRPFQQSLACFRVARSPSNSWASCFYQELIGHDPISLLLLLFLFLWFSLEQSSLKSLRLCRFKRDRSGIRPIVLRVKPHRITESDFWCGAVISRYAYAYANMIVDRRATGRAAGGLWILNRRPLVPDPLVHSYLFHLFSLDRKRP